MILCWDTPTTNPCTVLTPFCDLTLSKKLKRTNSFFVCIIMTLLVLRTKIMVLMQETQMLMERSLSCFGWKHMSKWINAKFNHSELNGRTNLCGLGLNERVGVWRETHMCLKWSWQRPHGMIIVLAEDGAQHHSVTHAVQEFHLCVFLNTHTHKHTFVLFVISWLCLCQYI